MPAGAKQTEKRGSNKKVAGKLPKTASRDATSKAEQNTAQQESSTNSASSSVGQHGQGTASSGAARHSTSKQKRASAPAYQGMHMAVQ